MAPRGFACSAHTRWTSCEPVWRRRHSRASLTACCTRCSSSLEKEGPKGLYRQRRADRSELTINFAAYETLSKLAKEHELGDGSTGDRVSGVRACTSAVASATATLPLPGPAPADACAQDRGHGSEEGVPRRSFAAEGQAGSTGGSYGVRKVVQR